MRPRLSVLRLVVCSAVIAVGTGCGFEQDGLKGKIAAPGVVGDGTGGAPSMPQGEPEPPPPMPKPPKNQLPDAGPRVEEPPPVVEPDAGVEPDATATPDAESAPTDTLPPPQSSRPAECDKPATLPIQATFRNYVPDSDDFTFDNEGFFLVRSGRDIARLTYGGPPEMVVRNVVGERNTIDSLRMLSAGDIVIADYTSDSLVRLDAGGKQRKLASLKSPNKLTVGPQGRLYVVGIEGDIYVVEPDSGKTTLIGRVDGRLRGLTFSPDYQILYVSDARNNRLLSLQMRPDGTADMPRIWAKNLGGGPDGLTTDICGNVYVSDHQSSSIRRVTPRGTVEVLANLDRTTSSIGFGSGKQGWDAKTLYTVSVERGGSYEVKVGVPAAPPPPP
jgi:sugar lactone lactonase YvrE